MDTYVLLNLKRRCEMRLRIPSAICCSKMNSASSALQDPRRGHSGHHRIYQNILPAAAQTSTFGISAANLFLRNLPSCGRVIRDICIAFVSQPDSFNKRVRSLLTSRSRSNLNYWASLFCAPEYFECQEFCLLSKTKWRF